MHTLLLIASRYLKRHLCLRIYQRDSLTFIYMFNFRSGQHLILSYLFHTLVYTLPICLCGATVQLGAQAASLLRFLDHTQPVGTL